MSLPIFLHRTARRCAKEHENYRRNRAYDPRFCFELFRRALYDCHPLAQELLYQQYGPQVTTWVRIHPRFSAIYEEPEVFVNGAFIRLWTYVTPEKFTAFKDLGGLLNYLRMCLNSEIEEYWRKEGPIHHRRAILPTTDRDAIDDEFLLQDSSVQPDHVALEHEFRLEFWHLVEQRLRNPKERIVIYATYVLDLKPRQIYAEHPDEFRNVKEVSRVKDNLIERLRRDMGLQKLIAKEQRA